MAEPLPGSMPPLAPLPCDVPPLAPPQVGWAKGALGSARGSAKDALSHAVSLEETAAALGHTVSVHGMALVKDAPKPDRKRLTKIEVKRKELLTRGFKQKGAVLLSWKGTVLSWACASPQLWAAVGTYVAVRLWARSGQDFETLPPVSMAQVSILSGFLYFFLVFYVGHGYSRFLSQYGASMSMEGRIFDSTTMAMASMPRGSAHRLMRHINGAHVLAYVGLNDTYNVSNFLRHFQRSNQLFTVAEWARVREIGADAGGAACRECIAWAIQDIQAEVRIQNDGFCIKTDRFCIQNDGFCR